MYDVEWSADALSAISEFWQSSPENMQKAIRAAAIAIHERLRRSADSEGESRPDGRRILFEAPFGLLFRVNAAARSVVVVKVWPFRQSAN